MKKYFGLILLLFSFLPLSWSQGINFETGTWKEVVAKAQKENKMIYLDVYTTWCGPCKMMSNNIFPTKEAGDKYNALFINYKVDAEKGEGKDIARKYGVGSYPTNLYINPKDESVVYRIAGACGVEEFLKRADIAMLDFNDPLTWEEYQKKLKKNPKDYNFLLQYIGKAERLGKDNDLALDYYVEQHMSLPPHDSNIYFLVMHTKTFDNKAYKILGANKERMDAMIKNPKDKFEEREKSYWFQNTMKKAVELKDEKVLLSIKPILTKYNKIDSTGKWFWLKEYYYRSIDDKKSQVNNYQSAIKYYTEFSPKERQKMDSLMWLENAKMLQAQYVSQRMQEADITKQLNAQKTKPEMSSGFTIGTLNNILNGSEYVLANFQKDKKWLTQAVKWCDEGLEIVDMNQTVWEKFNVNKIKSLFFLDKKEDALKWAEGVVKTLDQKQKNTKTFQDLIAQIKEGKL